MKKTNEVSKLVGVSRRTLQYYDDEGVLQVERSRDSDKRSGRKVKSTDEICFVGAKKWNTSGRCQK